MILDYVDIDVNNKEHANKLYSFYVDWQKDVEQSEDSAIKSFEEFTEKAKRACGIYKEWKLIFKDGNDIGTYFVALNGMVGIQFSRDIDDEEVFIEIAKHIDPTLKNKNIKVVSMNVGFIKKLHNLDLKKISGM